MKHIPFFIIIILAGCNTGDSQRNATTPQDTTQVSVESTQQVQPEKSAITLPEAKKYSNERFREVTVEKIGDHKFRVQGLGQIFEASFSWVVEDGHEELKKGFQMTDAGAPEWGKFSFVIEVPKKRENSTLHLVLFETSAKDGSRQYELPVVLY